MGKFKQNIINSKLFRVLLVLIISIVLAFIIAITDVFAGLELQKGEYGNKHKQSFELSPAKVLGMLIGKKLKPIVF